MIVFYTELDFYFLCNKTKTLRGKRAGERKSRRSLSELSAVPHATGLVEDKILHDLFRDYKLFDSHINRSGDGSGISNNN